MNEIHKERNHEITKCRQRERKNGPNKESTNKENKTKRRNELKK